MLAVAMNQRMRLDEFEELCKPYELPAFAYSYRKQACPEYFIVKVCVTTNEAGQMAYCDAGCDPIEINKHDHDRLVEVVKEKMEDARVDLLRLIKSIRWTISPLTEEEKCRILEARQEVRQNAQRDSRT